MNVSHLPDASKAYHDLEILLGSVYSALEDGVMHARSYFEEEKSKPETGLFAYLVRHRSRQHLRALNLHPENIDGLGDSLRAAGARFIELPGCGLLLTQGKYRVRVFKSRHGEIPHAGTSQSRQQFYQHNFEQGRLRFVEREAFQPVTTNVIALWHHTDTLKLLCMDLLCPISTGTFWSRVNALWRIRIPHPAETVSFEQEFIAFEDDGEFGYEHIDSVQDDESDDEESEQE